MKKFLRKKPIGVFDSGFGGLNILREIIKELPEYNYFYLGDTARAPYGSRSQEIIYEFTRQAIGFLFKQGCQLVILACNTASSKALRKIQQEYLPQYYPENKVLGVIIPTAETVAEQENKNVGVIATEGTIASNVFKKEIQKLNPEIKVFQRACPLLVPIIEAGEQDGKIIYLAIKDCLKPLLSENINALILGCTHYGLLKKEIEKITNKKIRIIAEGEIVAKKLKHYLQRHTEIERYLAKNSEKRFFTTDLTNRFRILGSQFLGEQISPEKITLEWENAA